MYYITKKEHITHNFYISCLDQKAEHMSQMQDIECRSNVKLRDLLNGFKLYHWNSKL